ncbi:MAG: hypothetical protein GY898_02875 [Proteobacteria bacterium]|nr:hypothetical protein [Pseudomonadota bacterium]
MADFVPVAVFEDEMTARAAAAALEEAELVVQAPAFALRELLPGVDNTALRMEIRVPSEDAAAAKAVLESGGFSETHAVEAIEDTEGRKTAAGLGCLIIVCQFGVAHLLLGKNVRGALIFASLVLSIWIGSSWVAPTFVLVLLVPPVDFIGAVFAARLDDGKPPTPFWTRFFAAAPRCSCWPC